MKKTDFDFQSSQAWTAFKQEYQLTHKQEEQFHHFVQELLNWNTVMNLTAIIDAPAVIRDHLQDSLAVTKFVSFNEHTSVCDVGTGAGFPGIPLKIMYPAMSIVLLEVNQKKIRFLTSIIEALQLQNIQISSLDFRTFIRQGPFPVSYFCARASLRPDELVRVFNAPAYKDATVIYWASKQFELSPKEEPYFFKEETYTLDHKERKLFFFLRR